ncbi:hypothetical protein CPB83DRAFT_896864 [Crepidotus variabilis]|uniref:Uncharacterized protein n=1 Tax=Crepidotus variabilis TaxID=179855 RepID=A0A9P6JM65_9AGAR|nr:hypothetical protein CPB83DRAFT_896864 [Crepidotus variabilis]
MKQIGLIPNVVTQLSDLHSSLGQMFEQWFGQHLIFDRLKPDSVHKEFFLQLAVEEIALQFLNGNSVTNLEAFLIRSTKANVVLLQGCPALFHVVNAQFRTVPALPKMLINLLQWVLIRGSIVMKQLTKYGYPHPNPPLGGSRNW